MRVAVTGATGFVGSALIEWLSNNDYDAVAVSRRRPEWIDSVNGAEYRASPELTSFGGWAEVFRNVDVVVHTAGLAHRTEKIAESTYTAINEQGTGNVVGGAIRAGVELFIFLSTVKVYGNSGSDQRVFAADDPPDPADAYARSKLGAERLVFQSVVGENMRSLVIRPVLVYGPGVGANFLRLLKATRKAVPLPLRSVNNSRSIVFMGNLCSLIGACLASSHLNQQVFIAADAKPISTNELLSMISRLMGKRSFLFPFPTALLRFIARALGFGPSVSALLDSYAVDLRKNREVLGWKPPYSTEDGLARTVEWYLGNLND